ncbi:unnamed protein product [Ilex paraguariensis]|uniref:Rad21/Rec8-like protein N-terminal domain-containing protein n=1 Tax=Ilex paraguariensis TaxID=185542 RepID=A0ABC8SCM0_9AQUA
MYPEVPIALRMSSHLLLGVVRIYSKQVEYLYHDCNVVLIGIRKAFSSVEINLPEDASHAPFYSVTLPNTFELDALDLDDDYYHDWFQDNHLRSQEEITLPDDQIPIGRDAYIVVTFDEVAMTTEVNERPNEDSIPQNIPEIEVIRDAVHDKNVPVWPDQGNHVLVPDRTSEQLVMEEEEIIPQVMEEILESGGHSLPSQQCQEPPSAASKQASEIYDTHISFGHVSPELAIQSTPPAEQPKGRPRKRKHHYDESTVLTNKFMKRALTDSSDIQRVRRDCPCSALGFWKLNNRLKKEKVFLDPLTSGLCVDLSNTYHKDFISLKLQLAHIEEAHPEPDNAHSPVPMPEIDMEIEHLREYASPASINLLSELLPSPNKFMSSPTRRDEFTPAFTTNLGSESNLLGTTIGTEVPSTSDLAASTGPVGSEMETPVLFSEEQLSFKNTGLSDIPELVKSAGDLNFLEEEDNSPAGSQGTPEFGYSSGIQKGTPEIDALSARTRAVAQYLKRQSSAAPVSEDLSGDLSLNNILEGKRKKVCARMFFETLA